MLTRLRVMIVEDEPLATRRLVRLLKPLPEIEIVALAENGRRALELIEAARPNLLLLDIEMPGLNGFDLLERLPAGAAPAVVFVTAFDGYALKAFRVRAADFLLKPVVPDQLEAALAQARRDLASREVEHKLAELQEMMAALRKRAGEAAPYDREFWVHARSERIRVPTGEIDWIEADKDYVRLHAGTRCFLVNALIGSVESRLDPTEFMRVHRSAIVRLDRIRSVHRRRYGVLDIELAEGATVRVGRKYAPRVRDRIAAGL